VRLLRRLGLGLVGLVLLWLVTLLLIGWLADGCVRDRAVARLGGSLGARVAIDDLDLALVRGTIGIDGLHIERDDRGYLRLDIDRVDAEIAPAGLALFDRDLGAIRVRGVDFEVSALGALARRDGAGGGEPVTFESIEVEDVKMRLEATSWWPGLAKLDVVVERARAGRTTLRTPMSWLFALRELTARIDLTETISIRLRYAAGMITLSGSLFDQPVELPFQIPILEPAREVEQLAQMGKALVAELVKHYARKKVEQLVP
jgi:hypothetical protein